MKWRWLLVLVMFVIAGGAIFVAMGGVTLGGGTAANRLLTAQATRRNVTKAVAATGTVASSATYGLAFGDSPHLGTSSSSGPGASTTWPVTSVSVVVGDSVKKGQTLASANTADLTTALDKLQTSLASAQVSLQQAKDTKSGAKADLQRQLDSANISAHIAEIQLRSAKVNLNDATGAAAIRQAKASELQAENSRAQARQQVADLKVQLAGSLPTETTALANAQSTVDDLQTQISDQEALIAGALLTSPVDGTVSAVNVVSGYDAPSGDAITVDANTLQVVADVVESDLPSVSVGQAATVTISAVSASVTGKVTSIAPAATTSGSSSVVSYPVTVTLTDPAATVRIGMSSDVSITVAEAQNVVAVPSVAVHGSTGNYTVEIADGSGGSAARAVTVGLITDTFTEIQSGVAEGDSVVIGTVSSAAQAAGGTTQTNTGGFTLGGGGAFPGGGNFGGGTRPGR